MWQSISIKQTTSHWQETASVSRTRLSKASVEKVTTVQTKKQRSRWPRYIKCPHTPRTYLRGRKMAENMDQNSEQNNDVSSRIDNGRITFNTTKFLGIDYPGLIKDENRMLETLGGEDTVARTYSISGRRLELSFRPRDPYCHAVCADRYPTANLLLRVKQRKKKRREGSEPPEVKYEQEILGIVANTFK